MSGHRHGMSSKSSNASRISGCFRTRIQYFFCSLISRSLTSLSSNLRSLASRNRVRIFLKISPTVRSPPGRGMFFHWGCFSDITAGVSIYDVIRFLVDSTRTCCWTYAGRCCTELWNEQGHLLWRSWWCTWLRAFQSSLYESLLVLGKLVWDRSAMLVERLATVSKVYFINSDLLRRILREVTIL